MWRSDSVALSFEQPEPDRHVRPEQLAGLPDDYSKLLFSERIASTLRIAAAVEPPPDLVHRRVARDWRGSRDHQHSGAR